MPCSIDGGYDGPREGDGANSSGEARFVLYPATGYSQSVTAQLFRNGIPCGLLYLETKEELEWLKERIDGRYSPERLGFDLTSRGTTEDFPSK
jgi:hypothetical protein